MIQTRDSSDISPWLFPLGHWACGYQRRSAGFIVHHCLPAVVRIAYTRCYAKFKKRFGVQSI